MMNDVEIDLAGLLAQRDEESARADGALHALALAYEHRFRLIEELKAARQEAWTYRQEVVRLKQIATTTTTSSESSVE